MICLDMQERLSAYLDGELSPEEMNETAEHLRSCEACQAVLSQLRQVRDELRSLPEVEVPEDLHSSIMQRIHSLAPHEADLGARLKPRKKPIINLDFRNWGYRQWVPAAAAAMVLVMFLSFSGALWYSSRYGNTFDGLYGAKTQEAVPGDASTKRSVSMAGESPEAAPPVSPSSGSSFGPEAAQKGASLMLAAPQDQPATLLDSARKIIRRAQLALEVSRGAVKPTSVQAVNVIQANFGYVETSSTSATDNDRKEVTSFFMVARVPADNLDKAVSDLTVLGRPTREDISAQDITDIYIDLDARLRNKENQEARLLQIMGQAQTVGELLQVEGELSRVRGDIESMRAQKNNYDKQVSLSTITLTIAEEGASIPKPPSPWAEVWRVFVEAWRQLMIFAAKAAPALTMLALLAAGGVSIVKRRRA